MGLGRKATQLAALALLVATAMWCAWSVQRGVRVAVEVSASPTGRYQVFWRKPGQVFTEARSQSQALPKGEGLRVIEFAIPTAWPSEVRLDPGSQPGEIKLNSIRVSSFLGSRTFRGKELLGLLQARSDIASLLEVNGNVVIQSSGADPHLVMRMPLNVREIVALAVILVVGSLVSFWRSRANRGAIALEDVSGRLSAESLTHRAFLSILAIGFVVCVALKLHGSSLHMWYQHFPSLFPTQDAPLVGNPRAIRSDEWLVFTPSMVSQATSAQPYAQQNLSIGAGAAPMLLGVPTDHGTTWARPQFWGFSLFGVERGYAWYWSYRIFACLCGVYLVLRILTRGRSMLAVAGSVWFFYSPFVQWWMSATVPDLVGSLTLALSCLSVIFTARTPLGISAASLGLILFATSFALQIYPPFQLPLAWLGVFMLPGLLLTRDVRERIRIHRSLRLALFALSGCFVLVNVGMYVASIQESLQVLAHTAYPGSRSVQGGGVSLSRYFLGFAALLMNEQSVPQAVGNISEGSTFLLVWPVALAVALTSLSRVALRPIIPVAMYLALFSGYAVFGWPGLLSKATLMSLAPSERVFIGIGLANVICVVMVLAALEKVSKSALLLGTLVTVAMGAVLPVYGEALFGEFMDRPEYLVCLIVMIALCLPILRGDRRGFGIAVVVISLVSAGRVNPISRGLAPFMSNYVKSAVAEVPERLRSRPWLVYGGFLLPQLFKAAGLEVVGGSKFVPQLDMWGRMDSSGQFKEVYNRYAHFQFQPQPSEEPMRMELVQADLVTVIVSPCGKEVAEAGIDVVVLPKSLASADMSCMTPVPSQLDQRGYRIYVRKE